jgi:hypothetical protein
MAFFGRFKRRRRARRTLLLTHATLTIDGRQAALIGCALYAVRHSISDTSPNAATQRAEVDRIIQELETQLTAQHPHAIADPWGFALVGLEGVAYMPVSASAQSSSAREINSR